MGFMAGSAVVLWFWDLGIEGYPNDAARSA